MDILTKTFGCLFKVFFDKLPIFSLQTNRIEIIVSSPEIGKINDNPGFVMCVFISFMMESQHIGERILIEKLVQIPKVFFATTPLNNVNFHGGNLFGRCHPDSVHLQCRPYEGVRIKQIKLGCVVTAFANDVGFSDSRKK